MTPQAGDSDVLAELGAAIERGRAAARARRELRAALPQVAGGELLAEHFLAEHGRLPHIGDDVPPWHYRGWLRICVQTLHAHGREHTGGFPDRWGYYIRTLEAGRLLDEPIPQVDFHRPDPKVLAETAKWVEVLERDGEGHWNALARLVEFMEYGLDTSQGRRPKVSDETAEALYRGIHVERWLQHPSDYLGTLASERFGGGPNAFFPTPAEVCELLGQVVMDPPLSGEPVGDSRLLRVYEPCCGTGRMLLAASNRSMNVGGGDKDGTVLAMARVNFAVYAPWVLYGLPFEHVARRRAEIANKLQEEGP